MDDSNNEKEKKGNMDIKPILNENYDKLLNDYNNLK